MIVHLAKSPSILSVFLNEIRDINIQNDAMRFRINLERISQILAMEMSKNLDYHSHEVQTPLGVKTSVDITNQPVIASILRAGLPMHYALLQYFDRAESSFIGAYRRHHKSGEIEIALDYITTPSLEGKTLILADPMIATGASIKLALEQLASFGKPNKIIILGIIASQQGLEMVQSLSQNIDIFIADIDEELSAKNYIIPGLGDAGDLAFGVKL